MSVDLRQALDALAVRRVPDGASTRLADRLDVLDRAVRRRRLRGHTVRGMASAAAVAAVALGAGAVGGWLDPRPPGPAEPGVTDTPTGASAGPTSTPTPTASEPVPCAEFPVQQGDGTGDYEGWWNGSPADAEANVLTDPADWPAIVRDHPRTIVVDTSTGQVVSAWDRLACDTFTPVAPPADPTWPADSIVVLDADTGAVVDSFPQRRSS